MNKKAFRADLLLLLTSCIWGLAFTAQRTGMEFLGPFTFNAIRFAMGSLSLLPLIFFLKAKRDKKEIQPENENEVQPRASFKSILINSLLAGIVLFSGAAFQQIGMIYTTAGNAGFITSLYVVLVPIFGLFIGRKTGIPTWIGAAAALIGLFFISQSDASSVDTSAAGSMSSINLGFILISLSAPLWALHVLLIDHLVKKIDPLILSCGQFAFCAIFSLIPALLTESVSAETLRGALTPLLYSGLGSVGIAYTLQAVAQQDAPPAHASILLCLESVFAAIGGIIILSEPVSARTFLGFACMFAGMIITQWDVLTKGQVKSKKEHNSQSAL
jgi:drug/metabolite transporter (DMT)-like permease